ncbi:post-GPI attachment to proteins factor 6 [Sitophilus oryzae]|uniref:Post-GPI attachment to proteins factor 6 n=1 Tax=Sitophilus oryzae TaxID=7048 RepID=A0A6J2YJL4_SITOR|nr:post-GPI attachment to proteins factor 6 [Sitophilus oryzae]
MCKLICFVVLIHLNLIVGQYDNLTLISKSRTANLEIYQAFADVVLMSFSLPDNTIYVSFKFIASEEALTVFGCVPRNVSIYLKHGAPPVINPDGALFPEDFRNVSRPAIFDVEFQTDREEVYVNITSPDPGVYYAAVFLAYEDPRFKQISQQGLTRSCDAFVDASVYVKQIDKPSIISELQTVKVTGVANSSNYFTIYVPNNVDHAIINVQSSEINRAILRTQARKPPSKTSYILQENIDNYTISAVFWTEPHVWHYIQFEFGPNSGSLSFEVKFLSSRVLTSSSNSSVLLTNKITDVLRYKQYDLARETAARSFTFSYRLGSELQNNVPVAVNITSNDFTVLRFNLRKGTDIGGTLQYILAFKPRITRSGRMITLEEEPEGNIVVGCIQKNSISVPIFPNLCSTPNSTVRSPLILNKTADNSTVLVPYPESGTWYASFKLFCGSCIPCNCSDACEQKFQSCANDCEKSCTANSSCANCFDSCKQSVIKLQECTQCDCDGGCLKKNASDVCNSSIIFDVSSRPCYYGDCGKQGQCLMMVSEGTAYSTCLCSNNYRGYDCSDGSLATPYGMVLLEFLLLILSNIFFLPVTYLAYRRRYYVEAVSYFCIFLSSTFYHACDAGENILSFCLFRLSTLQFADFFSAVLAIWLTLLAMADLPTVQLSILQMAGSIIIAFCVTLNRYALWIFALPSSVGVVIIGVSWYLKYRKYRQKFIISSYLYVKLPIGISVVSVGLIIYGVLQTQANYKYLHSLWHIIMAAGVFFLLPTNDTFQAEVLL